MDVFHGLHVIDRNGLDSVLELEEIPQVDGVSFFGCFQIIEEGFPLLIPKEFVHGLHNLFVESMGFAPIPGKHLVVPTFVESAPSGSPNPCRWRAWASAAMCSKVTPPIWEVVPKKHSSTTSSGEAYGLKNLSTAITAHGGNAHLRHDFEHAVLNGRSVVGNRLFDGNVQFAVLSPLADQINRKIRIDRRGTATDQTGKMMPSRASPVSQTMDDLRRLPSRIR